MWDQIVEYMAANGVWALLFLGLLVYQLKDSKKRAIRYGPYWSNAVAL